MANLLKIGQLKEHPADQEEIDRLLAAAGRGLADARLAAVSAETRCIDDASVGACIAEAERLLREIKARFGNGK